VSVLVLVIGNAPTGSQFDPRYPILAIVVLPGQHPYNVFAHPTTGVSVVGGL
jgi:hypothetical protein